MDPLDVEIEDPVLLGEVEMTAALIVAANQRDRPLTAAEIDEALGLPDRSGDGAVESSVPAEAAQA